MFPQAEKTNPGGSNLLITLSVNEEGESQIRESDGGERGERTSNAYADAAATAYMGASEIEDATAVIREAVRTRPCLYTGTAGARRTADREGGREVLDRRTYYATRGHTNEWARGRLGEGLTAGSHTHTAGVTGPLWSDVVRGTTTQMGQAPVDQGSARRARD